VFLRAEWLEVTNNVGPLISNLSFGYFPECCRMYVFLDALLGFTTEQPKLSFHLVDFVSLVAHLLDCLIEEFLQFSNFVFV
jgi:hypothetical protein